MVEITSREFHRNPVAKRKKLYLARDGSRDGQKPIRSCEGQGETLMPPVQHAEDA